MRSAFIEELTRLARENLKIVLLTGDLGYTVFEKFQEEFPSRYFNVGVSEANMIGVAAGLAHEGFRPFVYSIVPFATLRCLEQIRDDLAYHNLLVTVVGVGAGYSYGDMGATHHSIEDIAVTRCIPNMTVVCPGDPLEVRMLTRALLNLSGPSYLRLGKRGEPVVHTEQSIAALQVGKALVIQNGETVALIATGNMLPTAMQAAALLQSKHQLRPTVVSVHTVKPLDTRMIAEFAKNHKTLYTLEEHSVIGGLGSAIAEQVAQLHTRCQVHRIGVPDTFVTVSGSQAYYRERFGLTPEGIAQTILDNLAGVRETIKD